MEPATWRSYSQPLASRHPQGLLPSDQPAHSRRAPACPLRAHPVPQRSRATPPCIAPPRPGPRPAPPVVLQRMSLPADRPPRRPTRGNFQKPHRVAPRAPILHGAPPAGRSRIPRHHAGPAARGLPSFRPVGGHPADHPPLLPVAGLRVAGLGGVPLSFQRPIHQPG